MAVEAWGVKGYREPVEGLVIGQEVVSLIRSFCRSLPSEHPDREFVLALERKDPGCVREGTWQVF